MSDNRQTLGIDINVTKSGEGAKGAASDLRSLHDATSKASAATEDATKAEKKHAEGEEEHKGKIAGVNFELGESRRLLQGLGEAFGPALELFRAFLNPVVGGMTVILGLFAEAKAKLNEWDKEMDEAAARAAEHYGNMAEAIETANRRIINSQNEVTKSLRDIESAQRSVKEKYDETTAAIQRQEQAQIAITDAQEALALAKVQAAHKAGALDDVSEAREEARIKIEAESHRNQIAAAQDQRGITAKANELDNTLLNQHRLQETVDTLGPKENSRLAHLDTENGLPKQLEGLKKEKEKNEEEYQKQLAKVDEANNAAARMEFAHSTFGMGTEDDVKASRANADKVGEELKGLVGNRKRIDAAIQTNEDEQAKFALEQKNYEEAKAALEKIKDTIHQLTLEVEALRKAAKENAATRNTVSGIHAETEGVRAGIAPSPVDRTIENPGSLEDAESGAFAATHGGRATTAQANTINQLVAALNAIGMTNEAALKTISEAHGNTQKTLELYQQLQRAIQEQARQIKTQVGQAGAGT